jgi:putative FmdB family regulatory protein
MPIYEYRCASCGHQQEFLQKVSDAPLTVCPKCGKPELAKMVTAAGFQLKGSGWYATDFRNKGTAPAKSGDAAKADSKPSDSGGSGGTGSSGSGSSSSGSSGTGGSSAG